MIKDRRSVQMQVVRDYEDLGHWWAYNNGYKGVSKISKSNAQQGVFGEGGYRMLAKYEYVYSYDTIIAKMLDGRIKKDLPVVLLDATNSSATTEKHKSAVYNACKHMNVIRVNNVLANSKEAHIRNIVSMQNKILMKVKSYLSRKRDSTREMDLAELRFLVANANAYALRFGLSKNKYIKAINKIPLVMDESSSSVMMSIVELNDKFLKEQSALKKAANLKEYNAKAKIAKAKLESWKAGAAERPDMTFLEGIYLRVIDGKIESTQGSRVGLSDAIRAYSKYKKGELKRGEVVGGFTFMGVDKDKIAKIGCHSIPIQEIEKVLSHVTKVDLKKDVQEKSLGQVFDELNEAASEAGLLLNEWGSHGI